MPRFEIVAWCNGGVSAFEVEARGLADARRKGAEALRVFSGRVMSVRKIGDAADAK